MRCTRPWNSTPLWFVVACLLFLNLQYAPSIHDLQGAQRVDQKWGVDSGTSVELKSERGALEQLSMPLNLWETELAEEAKSQERRAARLREVDAVEPVLPPPPPSSPPPLASSPPPGLPSSPNVNVANPRCDEKPRTWQTTIWTHALPQHMAPTYPYLAQTNLPHHTLYISQLGSTQVAWWCPRLSSSITLYQRWDKEYITHLACSPT